MSLNPGSVGTRVLIGGVSFGLSVLGAVYAPRWVIAAALSVIAAALLPLGLEWITTPRPFRKFASVIRSANDQAESHPLLMRYYADTVDRTERDLRSILRGRFEFQVSEIPLMSAFAVSLIDERCTLLFPIRESNSETLFVTEQEGAVRYYEEIVKASQRLSSAGLAPVTRVFIYEGKDSDLNIETLQFIEQNLEDGVNVRMISKLDMPPDTYGLEWNDFGYYETRSGHRWVMMVRKSASIEAGALTDYSVETDPVIVDRYRKYSEEVVARTTDAATYIQNLRRPMNAQIWPVFFAEQGYEMRPPHGLSQADAEAIADSVVKGSDADSRESTRVMVLGFTPKLIEELNTKSNLEVISVDHIAVKPADADPSVRYMTTNWLELRCDERFDAIVFDESLNNLNALQNQMLFPVLAKTLKPGGHLIGRLLGQFDEQIAHRYRFKTRDNIIHTLKSIDGDRHEDFAPTIMKLLHSSQVAFDVERSIIDCRRWNRFLLEQMNLGAISEREYAMWTIKFEIKIFAPDLDFVISNGARANLTPCEIRRASGSYLDNDFELAEFYRIINLEHTPQLHREPG